MSSDRRCTIRKSECYSKAELIHRVGCKECTYRTWKRKGLKTTTIGQFEFVRGQDWFDFLEANQKK